MNEADEVSLASKPMPLTKPTTLTKPLTKPITKPLTEPLTEPLTKPLTKPLIKPLTKPTPLGVGGINEADESVIGLQLPNVELLVFIKALLDLQQPQESVNLQLNQESVNL